MAAPPRATYFCVDIECNGPVPGLYDMVSLGAVVVAHDAHGQLVVAQRGSGDPPEAPTSTRARRHPWPLPERLAAEGLSRAALCAALTAWVEEHRPGTEPVFVGHNAPFDWSFVSYTFAEQGLPNPFGYKALCTKALATGVLGVHWLDSGKELLCERLGLPAEDHSLKHRADYDAEYQAQILIGLLAAQDAQRG